MATHAEEEPRNAAFRVPQHTCTCTGVWEGASRLVGDLAAGEAWIAAEMRDVAAAARDACIHPGNCRCHCSTSW